MTESTQDNLSVYRFRWIGYGLLLFALIDAVQILIPLEFTNPTWELQTIGALVERVPVPLLGFALVFFGEFYDRLGLERLILKLLSWFCLLLCLLFLLMIPLGILGTARINNLNATQVNRQVEQQLTQLKQIEDQINQSSPAQIKTLATRLNQFGISVDPRNPDQLKKQVSTRISTVRSQLQAQSQAARSNQQRGLIKNSIKWNLGALISAALFFILWKSTGWARRRKNV